MHIATINKKRIRVKEYNSERVLTFKEIDLLHEQADGVAKRNFANNKENLTEGVDYYSLSLKQFRELFTPNATNGRGNPDLDVYLITEIGYLMLVKTFRGKLAWDVQRELITAYFRQKGRDESSEPERVNQFDLLRQIVDNLEEADRQDNHLYAIIKGLGGRIDELEDRLDNMNQPDMEFADPVQLSLDLPTIDEPFITTQLVTPGRLAAKLGLYATSGMPHAQLVTAIARRAGIKTKMYMSYQDDYIVIMREGNPEVGFSWQLYFKPKGEQLVTNWFLENQSQARYRELYKNRTKKNVPGDIKEIGYQLGNRRYKVAI